MNIISRNRIVSVAQERLLSLFKLANPRSPCEAVVLGHYTAWGFAPVLLAQIQDAGFKSFMAGAGRWLILLGALLLISAVAALIVIIRFRPGRHRHRHRHHRHQHSHGTEQNTTPTETGRKHHRHRRRRHVHQEFPKNPTLAETGGLPPVRPDDEPPKF